MQQSDLKIQTLEASLGSASLAKGALEAQVKALQDQLSFATVRNEDLQSENKTVQALVQKYKEDHDLKSTLLVCEITSILNRIVGSKDYEVPGFSLQKQEYQDLNEAMHRVKQKIDKARSNIQVLFAHPGGQTGRRARNSRDGQDDPQDLGNSVESLQVAHLGAHHKREP